MLFFISCKNNGLDLIWSGTQKTQGFYYRWSFCYSFFIIATCATYFEDIIQDKDIKKYIFIALLNTLILLLFYYSDFIFDENTNKSKILSIDSLVINEIFLILYITLLYLFSRYNKHIFLVLITLICIIEQLSNQYLQTMKSLGYGYNIFFTEYGFGNTILTDSIFGIKYKISNRNQKYFTKIEDDSNGNSLFENNYLLPLGYLSDIDFSNYSDIDFNISPFNYQTKYLNSITGLNLEYFRDIKLLNYKTNNININGDYVSKIIPGVESYIEYTYDVSDVKDEVYFYFKSNYSDERKAFKIFINDNFLTEYIGTDKNGILKIDTDNQNQLTIKMELNTNAKVNLENLCFKEINMDNFKEAYNKLSENKIDRATFVDNKLTINWNSNLTGKYIVTSIPYDPAWRCKSNEIMNFNNFMAIKVNPNQSEVSLEYIPTGLRLGTIISISSLCIFISYILINKKRLSRLSIKKSKV